MEYSDNQNVLIRLNGSFNKNKEETEVDISEMKDMNGLLKSLCKKFGSNKENYKSAKLYNKNGLQLFQDDLTLLNPGDILYIAIRGEEFNYSAILDDYTIVKELGQGGFGKVMLGRHKEEKKEVAIKFMDVSEQLASANMIQEIYREAESLKKLVHKNIVALYSSFMESKQLCMIMEYAGGGELLQYIEEKGKLSEVDARHIFVQIVNAMAYCHTRGIVHRDLKLENVLIKNKGDLIVKVVDFGIAGMCAGSKKDKVDAGSVAYMPPECLKGEAAETSPQIDVWAIGCMFYAMIYGHLPFWGDTEDQFIDKIINAPLKFDIDIPVSQPGKEIIKAMLNKDPEKRIELIEVMDKPYFNYEDTEIEEFIKIEQEKLEKNQKDEEEKAEKQWEQDIIQNLQLGNQQQQQSKKGTKQQKDKLVLNKNNNSSSKVQNKGKQQSVKMTQQVKQNSKRQI